MIERPLYVDKIMAYVDTPFVKILTGVRRCGKSTILKMIMERLKTERNIPEDRIISCRFDSMEYEDMTAKQIYTLLKDQLSSTGRTYLFLDEVQEIKGWEKPICFWTRFKKSRDGKRLLIRWRPILMLTCILQAPTPE